MLCDLIALEGHAAVFVRRVLSPLPPPDEPNLPAAPPPPPPPKKTTTTTTTTTTTAFTASPATFGIGVSTSFTLTDTSSTINTGSKFLILESGGDCQNVGGGTEIQNGGAGGTDLGATGAVGTITKTGVTLSPGAAKTGAKVCYAQDGTTFADTGKTIAVQSKLRAVAARP